MNCDWSKEEALRDSLREHMLLAKRRTELLAEAMYCLEVVYPALPPPSPFPGSSGKSALKAQIDKLQDKVYSEMGEDFINEWYGYD